MITAGNENEYISKVILQPPTQGHTSVDRTTKSSNYQLFADTECLRENLKRQIVSKREWESQRNSWYWRVLVMMINYLRMVVRKAASKTLKLKILDDSIVQKIYDYKNKKRKISHHFLQSKISLLLLLGWCRRRWGRRFHKKSIYIMLPNTQSALSMGFRVHWLHS